MLAVRARTRFALLPFFLTSVDSLDAEAKESGRDPGAQNLENEEAISAI